MEFGNVIKNKRLELGLTQETMSRELNITRQTLSRWENGISYPNLDTLITLSDSLNLSLEYLLKGEKNMIVEKISTDVRNTNKYKKITYTLATILVIILVFLSILGIGRANQNEIIDRINPFLTYKTGYAQLPANHEGISNIDSLVYDDPFGNGEWLKFNIGSKDVTKNTIALVSHKGSYVKTIRLIPSKDIPKYMKLQLSGNYEPYSKKTYGSRLNKSINWWPFN